MPERIQSVVQLATVQKQHKNTPKIQHSLAICNRRTVGHWLAVVYPERDNLDVRRSMQIGDPVLIAAARSGGYGKRRENGRCCAHWAAE